MVEVLNDVSAALRQEHLAGVSDAEIAHCLAIFDRIQGQAEAAASEDGDGMSLDYQAVRTD